MKITNRVFRKVNIGPKLVNNRKEKNTKPDAAGEQ